jgi:glycosyltransferase involved in cell wall biosynthesis
MPGEEQTQPLISVVMPVYNIAAYLDEAISSILAQTYPNIEIIIVDDGSTDDSAEVVRAWASRDERIRPLFIAHGGAGKARNEGIKIALGEYLAFHDADDIALPERLSVQLAWMQENNVDICGGCAKGFGDGDIILWVPESHEAIRHELIFRLAMYLPTIMMPLKIAQENPFHEEAALEDYELWTRLAPRYRFGNMPQVLLRYRSHAQQRHIVLLDGVIADSQAYRERYFHALFPEASAADFEAVRRVNEGVPMENLEQLELAGEWLISLASTPDAFINRRMAERWQGTCQRSAHLGWEGYRLYKRLASRFGEANMESTFILKVSCALRLNTDGRVYRWLAEARKKRAARVRREIIRN